MAPWLGSGSGVNGAGPGLGMGTKETPGPEGGVGALHAEASDPTRAGLMGSYL